MPIYEYQCESCNTRFDKMQRFSEDPLTECPMCGGPVYRVIQPVGIIFKGSGFYVTDNRGKSSTMPSSNRDEKGTKAEDKSESSSTEKGSTKTSEKKASEGSTAKTESG
ncbi:MAG: FmdB family zinc ribbon protein [Chloroflexota bacterium]|nr:FmdB family zinc ribbon protein [Chloroflexota bacterium]